MLNRFSWGLAGCLLVAALATSIMAQERGQGRGRGGFGFFDISLVRLAANEAVQRELGLGDADKSKIETIARESNEARGDALRAAGVDFQSFRNLSDDEQRAVREKIRAATAKVNEQTDAKLKEALTADQFKRLQEIAVHAAGSRALNDPRVAKELALTDDQNKKIAEIRAEFEQKQQSLGRDASREARSELRDEEAKKVTAVLTKEQQDKFTALKGKEFDTSVLRQGFRGGNREGGNRPEGGRPRTKRPATE